MRWNIFAIGKPSLPFAKLGIEEYLKRLSRQQVELHFLKVPNPRNESATLLEKSEGMYRIALDERGDLPTTEQFSKKISHWERIGVKNAALLIGGSDGHTDELRKKCDWSWSLSKLTLQHEFALVLVLEQIYRAHSILSGHPYHRA